jgi:DNA-directed RNA polymerase II subunit RPB1
MVPIYRSGILNDNIGPISKSTFEVHTEVLLNASRHAEFDHMRGVSANVMTGQMGLFGTGSFQLMVDVAKMASVSASDVNTSDVNQDIKKMFGGLEDKTDVCSKNNIEIQNNLATVKQSDMGGCDDDYDIGF